MRPSEKRYRLIEFLNYVSHHEHKTLYPINETINRFTMKTNINIAQSTAYRIIKKYIDNQLLLYHEQLNSQINNEILEIFNS